MAANLDDILADSRVAATRALREAHAARARDAQKRYWRYSRLFVFGTALAAIAGALILYGAGADATGAVSRAATEAATADAGQAAQAPETRSAELAVFLSASWMRTLLFVVQVASLAAAAFAAEMLRETRVGLDWLSERRAAETGRIALFDTIWAVAVDTGVEFQKLAFEHFVSEQLQKQKAFHEAAEMRHRRSASRSAVWGGLLAAGIAATGAAGVGGAAWIAVAALVGILSPILMNALRGWRETTLDREKSERYRQAWAELTRLCGEVDGARAALATGDLAKAKALIDQVHAVMRAEHEGWTPTTAKQ